MKKVIVTASLLLGFCCLNASVHAAQQEAEKEIKQKINKKAKTVAASANVSFVGAPRFVPIERTSILYATNTSEEVINISDVFYLNTQGVWLVAANPQGLWTAALYVPKVVSAIECSQLNFDPNDPYELCALPWASGKDYGG